VYLSRPTDRCGIPVRLVEGVVINPASIAAIALGFATYVGFFFPLGDGGVRTVAVASIMGLTLLNSLGVGSERSRKTCSP